MEMDTGKADMGEDHEFNYKPMKIKIWEQFSDYLLIQTSKNIYLFVY